MRVGQWKKIGMALAIASQGVTAFQVSNTRRFTNRFLSQSSKSISGPARTGGAGFQLNMILDRLLGALQEPKIDYNALDFPGPELGKAALEGKVLVQSERNNLNIATFAGGCFWGLELAFQRVPGVEYTAVGYTQGPETEPTYGQVCSGGTGHTEAVIVYYDPEVCSYSNLLDTFFNRVDPTTVNGQGRDFGTQYRTGVYYHTPEQEALAKERFQQEQGNYRRKIASECMAATPFWPAEKYHQQYLEKGGRFGESQSAEKGCEDTIRCYG